MNLTEQRLLYYLMNKLPNRVEIADLLLDYPTVFEKPESPEVLRRTLDSLLQARMVSYVPGGLYKVEPHMLERIKAFGVQTIPKEIVLDETPVVAETAEAKPKKKAKKESDSSGTGTVG